MEKDNEKEVFGKILEEIECSTEIDVKEEMSKIADAMAADGSVQPRIKQMREKLIGIPGGCKVSHHDEAQMSKAEGVQMNPRAARRMLKELEKNGVTDGLDADTKGRIQETRRGR